MSRARAAAESAGLPVNVLDDNVETVSGRVSIGTMHLAKGLEFRAVVVTSTTMVILHQEQLKPSWTIRIWKRYTTRSVSCSTWRAPGHGITCWSRAWNQHRNSWTICGSEVPKSSGTGHAGGSFRAHEGAAGFWGLRHRLPQFAHIGAPARMAACPTMPWPGATVAPVLADHGVPTGGFWGYPRL